MARLISASSHKPKWARYFLSVDSKANIHPETHQGPNRSYRPVEPVYVVTDVEVDGATPGENSMLSFASVAVNAKGEEADSFQAVLNTLDGATPDPLTMAWFQSQPEALAAATHSPEPPREVVARFVHWVQGLPGDAIFVAHPLAMDGPWMDFYLRRFAGIRLLKGPWTGERLFYAGGLCLRSFAAGKLNWPLWECSPENYPPEWLGHCSHTHKAIDDARAYARLLAFLMD